MKTSEEFECNTYIPLGYAIKYTMMPNRSTSFDMKGGIFGYIAFAWLSEALIDFLTIVPFELAYEFQFRSDKVKLPTVISE